MDVNVFVNNEIDFMRRMVVKNIGVVFLSLLFYRCATPKQIEWSKMPSIHQNQLDEKWPQHPYFKNLFDPHTGSVATGYIVVEGYILTKINDTLKGYIKMPIVNEWNKPLSPIPFLPFNKTAATDIVNIKIDSLNYIRVKLSNSTDSVDYLPFKSTLWLLVGRKNNINICYQKWFHDIYDPDNPFQEMDNNELILISKNEATRIFLTKNFSFHNYPFLIIKFINKRYNIHLHKKDFKDEKAMIDYILDKETEK